MITRPALRYHGAKFRLAPWCMQFFPAHRIYTEAFGGAAGVLLRKPRAYAEVYNDLDGDVVNFFRVLRDPSTRETLELALSLTPYARDEFDLSWEPTDDAIERARRTAIRAQMGFGSAGATKGSTGLRTDTKRKHTTAQMDWLSYPAAVAAAGQRFAGVLIENRPAIDVLQQHDTRVLRAQGGYRHELSDDDHDELLAAILELEGFVVLCGYESDLYNVALAGWEKHSTDSRISAGRGTVMRKEVVWLNPACSSALHARSGLFAETTCV